MKRQKPGSVRAACLFALLLGLNKAGPQDTASPLPSPDAAPAPRRPGPAPAFPALPTSASHGLRTTATHHPPGRHPILQRARADKKLPPTGDFVAQVHIGDKAYYQFRSRTSSTSRTWYSLRRVKSLSGDFQRTWPTTDEAAKAKVNQVRQRLPRPPPIAPLTKTPSHKSLPDNFAPSLPTRLHASLVRIAPPPPRTPFPLGNPQAVQGSRRVDAAPD